VGIDVVNPQEHGFTDVVIKDIVPTGSLLNSIYF